MALLTGNDVQVNQVDRYRAILMDICKRYPTANQSSLMQTVSGIDIDDGEHTIADVHAWFAEHHDNDDDEIDGYSFSARIAAFYSLMFKDMAGSIAPNEKMVDTLFNKLHSVLKNGEAISKLNLISKIRPDFDKNDPQQTADMDEAFTRLTKRADIQRLDKEKNLLEGRGRWSLLRRIAPADTAK